GRQNKQKHIGCSFFRSVRVILSLLGAISSFDFLKNRGTAGIRGRKCPVIGVKNQGGGRTFDVNRPPIVAATPPIRNERIGLFLLLAQGLQIAHSLLEFHELGGEPGKFHLSSLGFLLLLSGGLKLRRNLLFLLKKSRLLGLELLL